MLETSNNADCDGLILWVGLWKIVWTLWVVTNIVTLPFRRPEADNIVV